MRARVVIDTLTKRANWLTLVPDTFGDQRLLAALWNVIDGGTIVVVPNEGKQVEGVFPTEDESDE